MQRSTYKSQDPKQPVNFKPDFKNPQPHKHRYGQKNICQNTQRNNKLIHVNVFKQQSVTHMYMKNGHFPVPSETIYPLFSMHPNETILPASDTPKLSPHFQGV